MYFTSPAEIFGFDGVIVLIVVVLCCSDPPRFLNWPARWARRRRSSRKGIDQGATEDGTSATGFPRLLPPLM